MEPSSKKTKPGSKARTVEDKENELISLAAALAKKQLAAGTASPSVITHFLKLGTTRAQLEKAKLENENLLLQAKADALRAAAKNEERYALAIEAMRKYSGQKVEKEEIDDE